MKKILSALLLLSISLGTAMAQSKVFDDEYVKYDSTVISGIKYMFRNDDDYSGWIYRSTAWPVHAYPKENGNLIPLEKLESGQEKDYVNRTAAFDNTVDSIFKEHFANKDPNSFKDELTGAFYFGPDGKMIGVKLMVNLWETGFGSLPFRDLALFEKKLMDRDIRMSITPKGQKRNYNIVIWSNPVTW